MAPRKILGNLKGVVEKQVLLQWAEERTFDEKVEILITENFSQSFRVTGIRQMISSRINAGPKVFVFCPLLF